MTVLSLKHPDLCDDQAAFYSAAKALSPIFYSDLDGCYIASRYQDVKNLIGDYTIYDSRLGSLQDRQVKEEGLEFDPIFLQSPPQHTRMRKLAANAYSISAASKLGETANEIAENLVENLEEQGPQFDVISQYAEPMVITSILNLLEIPSCKHQILSNILQTIIRRNKFTPKEMDLAASELAARIAEHMSYVKGSEACGFSGDIVNANVDGDSFSKGESFGMLLMGIIAGTEDMIRGLANVIYALWLFPQANQLLISDIDRQVNTAVSEALRLFPTTQYLRRVTKRAIKLQNVNMPKGTTIVGLIGSANRDEAIFANPDMFNLERKNLSASLTFGSGPHVCIGRHIAKIVLGAGTKALLRRFSRLEIDIFNSTRVNNPPIVGFSRLIATPRI